jgi:predicted dehydrogenase
MMRHQLRAVVVGTSFGGRVHVPALQAAGFDVVAVVGRDAERTHARARALGVPHAFTSLDEALALPDIDAVTVSTPPDAHTAPVLQAIAQGKHVLCEKPFALDANDGERMYEAAVDAGVVHMCCFEFRWRPEEAVAKRAIDGGFLGSVEFGTCVQITALVAGGVHEAFNEEWWFDRARGGGILNASGSHYIDRFRMWFGEVEAVSARLQVVGDHSDDDAEDTYTMTLRMASGATAFIQQCSASWGESFRTIRAVGDHGSVWVGRDTAILATRDGTRELEVPDDLQVPPEPPRRPEDPKHAFTFMELPPFIRLAERFRDAIDANDPHYTPHVGAPPSPTFRDALMVQRAIDAARRSSERDGAWVDVEPLPQSPSGH